MADQLFNRRDLIAYFVVAATGALTNLLVATILQEWLPISYKSALFAGYWFSFIVGYFLTRLFAFNARNTTQTRRQIVKFIMVSILSCLITVYGSAILYDISRQWFGTFIFLIPFSVKEVNLNKLFSQIAAMGASFLSNYVLHKQFTFRDTGFYDRLKRLLDI
ncbi:putative flippase GtrA [Dyadobacter sp. BE34]|uniref:Flippase GtrA n=1 Tax=Dyadobacter fermentans TaxID=94254 RepID=A0ABU1QWI8_9BACT|nr:MULTISPECIES: GtrA family protein [Dyadobacter]MDR6805521.1 putative flippase GtrA [Dyadobacter fermentans]MDR7042719.1 putative flippase GtrA [Dyadobacter sp. BE242]MDR7197031.1 putative flippase GtrA [Dyadobacter sp. BE34]MDR7215534.1 putative flippase GtrA [Dyadobacter sp. BE31]MDR7263070.1 putative flippase GtrA [Dyadobacter sp. BE32]